MFTPKGYSCGSYYVGFFPDGSKGRFETEDEYVHYVREKEEEED